MIYSSLISYPIKTFINLNLYKQTIPNVAIAKTETIINALKTDFSNLIVLLFDILLFVSKAVNDASSLELSILLTTFYHFKIYFIYIYIDPVILFNDYLYMIVGDIY